MDYIVMTKEATPPFQKFDTYGDAVRHALSLGSAGSTIWQKTGETVLDVQQCDLLPVVPEPPRRGRPRKVEKRPEKPATPSALLIDSYGCAKDSDGVYRADILYTRNGVTGSAIGKHEDSAEQATWDALTAMGIVYLPDLEALPDTEGKRQLLAALAHE